MSVAKSLCLSSLLLALPALAGEQAGVKMPDSMQLEGKQLKLNGMGIRKKVVFKVYVAGLYVETPSKDAGAIIEADQVKRVEIQMTRNVDKASFTEAVVKGFEANNKDRMSALKERLDQLANAIPDLKEGQRISVTYVPGKGTTIEDPAGKALLLPGKDFADGMFRVWLGSSPVDSGLKEGLLGT